MIKFTFKDWICAWIAKQLGIKSPSAMWASDGKIKYYYDWMVSIKKQKKARFKIFHQ